GAQGQGEGERAAGAGLAVHPYPTVVELDELFHQRQPEPSPLWGRRGPSTDLDELLEDPLVVLWGDPWTAIADGDLDRLPDPGLKHHVHLSAIRREFHCVGTQREHDLLNLPLVT